MHAANSRVPPFRHLVHRRGQELRRRVRQWCLLLADPVMAYEMARARDRRRWLGSISGSTGAPLHHLEERDAHACVVALSPRDQRRTLESGRVNRPAREKGKKRRQRRFRSPVVVCGVLISVPSCSLKRGAGGREQDT